MSLRRSSSGTSTLELVCGLMVLVPLILFGIDFAFVYEAGFRNGTLCREAARAAASGPPSAYFANAPQKRAWQVVQSYNHKSSVEFNLSGPVSEQLVEPLPKPPLGGAVDGQVTVSTQVTVHPPFILGVTAGKRGIVINATETFPYTYAVPATSQDAPIGTASSGAMP